MNSNDRIEYSPEQLLLSVENMLGQLDVFRYDSQYKKLLGINFVEKLTKWEETIRKRRDDPFTLTVIGDFKRGKSTFINALLGEEIATTDVTTETVTLNRISYGASENKAVLSGVRRLRLTDEELKRERLEKALKQADEPVTMLELKRLNAMLKDITIVDTPGMNDALKDFEGMIKESVMEADAIVYIYNVLYPLSMTEQMFLKAAVFPQKYTKLFIVGNYTDTLATQENYEKVRGFLGERLHNLLPDAEIFMVSALDELCRKLNEQQDAETSTAERPCEALIPVLEEQFDLLRDSLQKIIDEKKEHVVTDRVLRLTTAMIESLSAEIQSVEVGLDMTEEDALRMLAKIKSEQEDGIRKQEQLRSEMKSMIQLMQEEATAWMLEFLERIENEIPKLQRESSDVLCKYYQFYCMDLIQEAMDICVDYHREKIYEKIESISADLVKNLFSTIDKNKKYTLTINLDNKMWTKGDTVGLAANMVSSMGAIGSIFGLLGSVAAGIMRNPEVKARSGEFVQQISGKISGLNHQVVAAVKDVYQSMGEKAEKLIAEYYADELAEVERSATQSADVACAEESEKTEIREAVAKAKTILEECLKNMKI